MQKIGVFTINLFLFLDVSNCVPVFPQVSFPPAVDFFEDHSTFNFDPLWGTFLPLHHQISIAGNGHVSPDFSNGLEYPDPYLLRFEIARRVVPLLYSRELFFGDIPHVKLLLGKQEERRVMGLPGNTLGSSRNTSPFHRHRLQKYLRF